MSHDTLLSRRTELVLRELDSLPTLPAVATKLIELGSRQDVEVREIVRLIELDPTLTAKLLGLCRKAANRTRYPITTVEMAVVMLGLDAVRSLVLSVQIFEWAQRFSRPSSRPTQSELQAEDRRERVIGSAEFDPTGFWQHSIAVACCAELIAQEHPDLQIASEEAFVCGLVHDLGKLALDLVLPKSYARVIELAHMRQGDIADFEKPIVGLDHHDAGMHLAEVWGLPKVLCNVMGHHHHAPQEIPEELDDPEQRRMIGLIGFADVLARKLALGWSGNHTAICDEQKLARQAGLDWLRIEGLLPKIYEATSSRCKELGLGEEPSQQLLIESILRANAQLGHLNQKLTEANQSLQDTQSQLAQARAMASLGEMTAGAAHEMNNPLTVISGRAQTLRKRAETEQDRLASQAIIDAASRLTTLIQRLNRIAAPPTPHMLPCDLKQTMEEAVVRAKSVIAGASNPSSLLSIRVTVADGIGSVRMDQGLFCDALTEILINAIEAKPRSCIEMKAAVDSENRIRIQITDDGIGMNEHTLNHATDPFFSFKLAGRQTGLGLALARRLLELHGADLSITSTQGKGTTVWIVMENWRWVRQN